MIKTCIKCDLNSYLLTSRDPDYDGTDWQELYSEVLGIVKVIDSWLCCTNMSPFHYAFSMHFLISSYN